MQEILYTAKSSSDTAEVDSGFSLEVIVTWFCTGLKLDVDEFQRSVQRFSIQEGAEGGEGFPRGTPAACVAKWLLGKRCPSKAERAETGSHLRHVLDKLSVLHIFSELSWWYNRQYW